MGAFENEMTGFSVCGSNWSFAGTLLTPVRNAQSAGSSLSVPSWFDLVGAQRRERRRRRAAVARAVVPLERPVAATDDGRRARPARCALLGGQEHDVLTVRLHLRLDVRRRVLRHDIDAVVALGCEDGIPVDRRVGRAGLRGDVACRRAWRPGRPCRCTRTRPSSSSTGTARRGRSPRRRPSRRSSGRTAGTPPRSSAGSGRSPPRTSRRPGDTRRRRPTRSSRLRWSSPWPSTASRRRRRRPPPDAAAVRQASSDGGQGATHSASSWPAARPPPPQWTSRRGPGRRTTCVVTARALMAEHRAAGRFFTRRRARQLRPRAGGRRRRRLPARDPGLLAPLPQGPAGARGPRAARRGLRPAGVRARRAARGLPVRARRVTAPGWRRRVDALGLERFHLVIHDYGGAVGFELCARRPRAHPLADDPRHGPRRRALPAAPAHRVRPHLGAGAAPAACAARGRSGTARCCASASSTRRR